MLKHGEHRGHGATKIVSIQGHGYVNGGGRRGAAVLAVAEGRGLPEERELRGRTADKAEANGGGDGEEEEEGQEAN